MIKEKQRFSGPVPGQAMTAGEKSRPWLNPPKYNTVEEAMEYYIKKLEDPDFVPELLTVIELGVPLTTLANTMQLASVMEGKHSIDVGMLAIPILVELMSNMAEANQVPFKSGMEREETGEISPATIALARKQGKLKAMKGAEEPAPQPQPEQPPEQPPMGLMTRREQ